MERRSFLKAAGAALFVPSFYLANPKLTTAIDLSDFVADDEWACYDLSRPFRQGEMTYATDARICVRTRLGVSDLADEQAKLPPVAGLPWDAGDGWLPWPKRKLVAEGGHFPSLCPQCEGKGRVGCDVVDCAVCRGAGGNYFDRADNWHAHCDNCAGCGRVGGTWCDYCKGRTTVDSDVPAVQVIGDQIIAPGYDCKIRKLCDVEYQLVPGPIFPGVTVGRMIRFRCNGAEGLLMPIVRAA